MPIQLPSLPADVSGVLPGVRFSLLNAYDADRADVEAFIAKAYHRHFGATLPAFAPYLFVLRTVDGAPIATAGLRPAGNTALFLEQYLDAPIESVLQERLNRLVRREQIIEVGNLIATRPGDGRLLIRVLTRLIHQGGYHWAAFTAVSAVRNLFLHLGLNLITLCPADPLLLVEDRYRWGTYYECNPWVMAGDVVRGLRHLEVLSDVRSSSIGNKSEWLAWRGSWA